MYRLDAAQGVLFCDGEPVTLVPKAVDLLRVLAERAGRVVSKDELMSAVWPDVTVEEGNLAKLVFLLRRELGQQAIETVPRRGYRLAVVVQTEDAPPAISAAAYDLYLEGRLLWNRRPGEVVWRALECFQKAIELAPRFAAAWAGIADVYSTLGSWEAGVLPHADAQSKAWSYASRALELDPELVEAQTTCAYSVLHYGWDVAGAEDRFRRAIALAETYPPAHHWYSHCLVAAGRFDESAEASRRALAREPMNLLLRVHLAWHHAMAGELEAALDQAERVIKMDPQFHWAHYFAGWAAGELGDRARAVDSMRRAVDLSGGDLVMRAGLGRALASAGERAGAEEVAAALAPHGRHDYELALIHLALGDQAAAHAALVRATAVRSGWMVYAAVDPRLAGIRDRLPERTPMSL